MAKLNLQYSNRQNIPLDKCDVCNGTHELERHRILPGRKGGAYSNDNVVILCDKCHKIVHKLIQQVKRTNPALDGYSYSDFVTAARNLFTGNVL